MDVVEAVIAAGVGFRAGVAAETIAEAVRVALRAACLPATFIPAAPMAGPDAADAAGHVSGVASLLATAATKADDPAFREAAALLGMTPAPVSDEGLHAAAPGCLTRSERSFALHGVPSLAEAAALAAAGSRARLLAPRLTHRGAVTCALAESAR